MMWLPASHSLPLARSMTNREIRKQQQRIRFFSFNFAFHFFFSYFRKWDLWKVFYIYDVPSSSLHVCIFIAIHFCTQNMKEITITQEIETKNHYCDLFRSTNILNCSLLATEKKRFELLSVLVEMNFSLVVFFSLLADLSRLSQR